MRTPLPPQRHFADLAIPQAGNPVHAKSVDVITRFGFVVMGVMADPEQALPGYSYTTGLTYTWGVPEALVFGLPTDAAHGIMHDYLAWALRVGGFSPPTISNEIASMPVRLHELVREWREHCLLSCWLYGTRPWSGVQIVWPDPAGRFPGDPRFDSRYRRIQPDCSIPPSASN